ncbi:MAG: RNA polymerase sigma factor [Myxococcales bacterium]|nr:RNA polymerase sigma factor [Myxococcales bacterium]MCB9748933.1 RNA polymerase sigma factor [Myxococcales bacterium]
MSNVATIHRLRPAPDPDAHAGAASESAPERGPCDDAETVRRACAGDPVLWGQLYQRSYAGLFRQLRYLTGDRAIAEELAQETFAQAMTARRRYDGRKGFRPWLHGIALNVVRKHWRKQRNTTRAHERLETLAELKRDLSEGTGNPDAGYLRRERSRALYTALEELPPRLREAFVLRELQGLSTTEAAAQLDITTGNLAVRVTRARARLRDLLRADGWITTGGGHD